MSSIKKFLERKGDDSYHISEISMIFDYLGGNIEIMREGISISYNGKTGTVGKCRPTQRSVGVFFSEKSIEMNYIDYLSLKIKENNELFQYLFKFEETKEFVDFDTFPDVDEDDLLDEQKFVYSEEDVDGFYEVIKEILNKKSEEYKELKFKCLKALSFQSSSDLVGAELYKRGIFVNKK